MKFTEFRQQMLIAVNTINKLMENNSSRELSIVRTELQNAQMFSGKMIGLLQEAPHPYKNDGKRVTKEDIEPMYGVVDDVYDIFKDDNTVKSIDQFRQILKEKSDYLYKSIDADDFEAAVPVSKEPGNELKFLTYVITLGASIDKARMWLGMELNRMRNEEK